MPMLQRFRDAAFGLGITLVPIAALACVQLLLVPYTAVSVFMADPEIEARVMSSFRGELLRGYAVIALIIAAHWLLTAALGRGQILRIRSANIVLALSVLSFAFTALIVSTVARPAGLFKGACPLLGLSDEAPPFSEGQTDFAFDGQTPCEAFGTGAAPIVLLGLPLILLATSAILRIAVSRRRFR